jgi:hypothetical protein
MAMKTIHRFKSAFATAAFTSLLVIISFIVFGLFIALFGSQSVNFWLMVPFISGYLHTGIDHFAFNMLVVFLCMLSETNRDMDYKKIYWVTLFISILYLPIALLGITAPAIGISGTCYFMMTRYFLRWRRKHWGTFLLLFLLICERLSTTTDQAIAYWVHYIGVILGVFTYYYQNIEAILFSRQNYQLLLLKIPKHS